VSQYKTFIDTLRGLRYIVINDCYGGFGLSEEALDMYKDMAGITDIYDRDIKRDDLYLVKIVKEMGDAAGGRFSKLKIIAIPDDVDWIIQEYDGAEWIAERHRTWS
jgi:hypothetical protein